MKNEYSSKKLRCINAAQFLSYRKLRFLYDKSRLEFFCEFLYFIYVQHFADGVEWNCLEGFESLTS